KDIDKLYDFSYLIKNFYTVDSKTAAGSELLNVDNFLNTDLKIDKSIDGPKVLIFHTHSYETYFDSKDESEGVLGVGELLKQELENVYGIETYHYTSGLRDIGGSVNTAYEDIEPPVREILEQNPSIQVVIDLHRDGIDVKEGAPIRKFVTEIDGQPVAQIMFFNGLSILNEDGVAKEITSLPNPYLDTNLAMSFNMQLMANELFPGFTRKMYLKTYRYSLHMMPKSLLIEVGANTNTKEEAFNTAKPLAEILANVID
ncbi:MAG: stage II sporulation protein P, partial [Clostridiales bacterium]|nr:stage II sporulation protein P [Clostridiales bacterium]